MGTDSMHQYDGPTPVSAATMSHCQPTNETLPLSPVISIPATHDLSTIRKDLQSLLPALRKRKQQFAKDLNGLKRKKTDKTHEDKTAVVGKNQNGAPVQVKQEASDSMSTTLGCTAQDTPEPSLSRSSPLSEPSGAQRQRHTVQGKGLGGLSMEQAETIAARRGNETQISRMASPSAETRTSMAAPKASTTTLPRHDIMRASTGSRSETPDHTDFIRVKEKDQVSVATFWAAVNPYFRSLTEEDRAFLLTKGDKVKPYLIPPLGRYYADVWAEEERMAVPELCRATSPSNMSSRSSSRQSSHDPLATERPPYPPTSEAPSTPFHEEMMDGSLTDRLLSCLVREQVVDAADLYGQDDDEDDPQDRIEPDELLPKHDGGGRSILDMIPAPPDEVVDFEERLKRELRYAGLFGEDHLDWHAHEDDEICAELRRASRELKEQVKTNEARKARLLDVVDRQLQYEQYQHILNTLNGQVDQCFVKRQKSKRRKNAAIAPAEAPAQIMQKRSTWIHALGHIFKDKDLSMPSHSIYDDL